MTFGVCSRCGFKYRWYRAPTAASLRELGRAIREHYERDHPGIEVNR